MPAGGVVELQIAPSNGCNCGAFSYRLAISGALATVFTQVNIIESDPAEYAEALTRRRIAAPYRGMPAERDPAEEQFELLPATPAVAAANGGSR